MRTSIFFFNIPLNIVVYFVYYYIKHKLTYCTRNTIITMYKTPTPLPPPADHILLLLSKYSMSTAAPQSISSFKRRRLV